MTSITTLGKRVFVDAFDAMEIVNGQPPIKQVKTGILSWEVFLNAGGRNVLSKVCVYLKAKDLISFECAAKVCQTVTDLAWQSLRQKKHFDFDWEACEKELYKHKWNYYLSAALIRYSKQKIALLSAWPNQEDREKFATKMDKQFEVLMNRFPSFGFYMKIDLRAIQNTFLLSLKPELKNQRQLIVKNFETWGGEFLLQTALNFYEYFISGKTNIKTFESMTFNLKKVIEKQASYASLLVLGVIENMKFTSGIEPQIAKQIKDLQWKIDLALLAAEKGNEHALKAIVEKMPLEDLQKLYDQGYRYYPILAKLAVCSSTDFNQRNNLLEQITKLYDQELFAKACHKIAAHHLWMGEFKPAQEFFKSAIRSYGRNVPLQVLQGFAQAKFDAYKEETAGVRSWAEVELLYQQIMAVYCNKIPVDVLRKMAYVKLKLSKWDEADAVYELVIATYGKSVPADVLNEAAYVKFKLNKLDKTKAYCTQAIQVYLNSRLEELQRKKSSNSYAAKTNLFSIYQSKWPEIASISKCAIEDWRVKISTLAQEASQQGEWTKADNFYQCLIENFSEDQSLSADILSNFAQVQARQKQWDKAEQLYDCAVAAYGESVPVDVIYEAAKVKCALGKWKEADNFYERILKPYRIYGANMPPGMLCDAAIVKMYQSQWSQAEDLYRDIIASNGPNVTITVLHNMANACFNQSKWEEAEKFYQEAINGYGQNVPPDVWNRAALVQLKLEKWTRADDFYTKAILSYGQQVPKKVLLNAAEVKLKLGKVKEAKDLKKRAV